MAGAAPWTPPEDGAAGAPVVTAAAALSLGGVCRAAEASQLALLDRQAPADARRRARLPGRLPSPGPPRLQPGRRGQAADPDSEFFADQAALWIANEASPVRFYLDDVIAAASGRELLTP